MRPELMLESWHFTTMSALAREVQALLDCTNYKFVILVAPEHYEELAAEIENWRILGRVKVSKVAEEKRKPPKREDEQ